MPAQQITLTTAQSRWLAQQLTFGVDYMMFGLEPNPQFVFFLNEAQWAEWMPKLPPAGADEAKPMLTYHEAEDGWTFQIDQDGKPVPGEFRFTQFCMGTTCTPSVDYRSGGFRGTRALRQYTEDEVRAKLVEMGFVENAQMK